MARLSPRTVARAITVGLLLIGAGALVEMGIEQVTHDPKWQGRFVVWILFAQTGALVLLAARAFNLVQQLRDQHRATTYIATVEGFLDTLAIGAESGGLPLDTRRRIYHACKEQFAWYHEAMGHGDRNTQSFFSGSDQDEPVQRDSGLAEIF